LLNELATLSRSLERAGVKAPPWHPWIKPFRNGPAIIVHMAADGSIARVSNLSADEVSALRNISSNNQNSFPGFNLRCPIWNAPNADVLPQTRERWEKALAGTLALGYKKQDLKRLRRLLTVFPAEEIAPRMKSGAAQIRATIALLDRLRLADYKPEEFLRQIADQLVAEVKTSSIPRDLAFAILFGEVNSKDKILEAWNVTVILDVADIENFPFRVADPANSLLWSELLIASELKRGSDDSSFRCSLTGLPDTPLGHKMPDPTLPLLGKTYLMSMNKEARCQTRYGRTGLAIFPTGKTGIQKASNALDFVTRNARRDKTWAAVPNSFRDQSDLLLTYVEEEPTADVALASLFADVDADQELNLATYEHRTAAVYEALKQRDRKAPDLHLRVIAISRVDPGRKQVLLSERYSLLAIYQARDKWIKGARNVPLVQVPFPAKKKPVQWRSGYQPSPSEVMISFRRQWLRAGQSSQTVPGVDLGRMYSLFLERNSNRQAQWLLERYLPLTQPLMIGLGQNLSGSAPLSDAARKESLIAIAVYGILLLNLERTKEIYMESRDFLLGRFLQLSDLLHKLYCEHERKGALPRQLIGNAAIPMALQRPSRGLEVLTSRIRVYLAWSEKYQGNEAGLARWTRKELAAVATQLKNCDLTKRVSPTGKAELLLGYLARLKQEEKEAN
jgi:hypothetical protein